jgi:hypothetical protein
LPKRVSGSSFSALHVAITERDDREALPGEQSGFFGVRSKKS